MQFCFGFSRRYKSRDPAVDEGLPLGAVISGDVQYACPADRGGCCESEVPDLEYEAHVRLEWDSFIGSESEHFVVVHHTIHGFDPVLGTEKARGLQ